MESGGRAGLQRQKQRQQAAGAGGGGGGGDGGGGGGGGGWVLLEARLQGGAPWGFTLQGGLEHGEPLIISKVEEGGKADCLEEPLQVGDEILIINEIELTGYRQEAIALVKGSYKTLQLTVRREFDPGYIEEVGSSHHSLPAPSTSCPSPPPLPPPPPPPPLQETPRPSHHSRTCSTSAVQLRIKNRRSEPASRPHSWHSTKLSEDHPELERGGMDTMSSAWHHSYHPCASTTDLSGGYDSGSYLRKSPDQYSSRGSMESLDPPQSSQLHSGSQHHHPMGHHTHGGPHPAYSSCHQLSSARSSNSIDHLHSKRDSAYSSFSTSSSIPEYLASNNSFSPERSYSLETVPQRGGPSGEMQKADMRYVRTVYDGQHGSSQEQELNSTSAALLRNSDSRGREGARPGQSRDSQSGICYRGNSGSGSSSVGSSGGALASNRHSVGPIWGQAAGGSSFESLKGAPAPPRRSDSYAAIRNHERPNSWSSLDHARSLRSLQKGSWHHSSGPVASAKSSYGIEGQLHTVIEKSPESSPTTKPRQGGFSQPPSPTAPSPGPSGHTTPSGRYILPTGMYTVPQPEPHFAQMPSISSGPGSSGVYPALAKESNLHQHQGLQGSGGREEGVIEERKDGRLSATENGYQNNASSSQYSHPSSSTSLQSRSQAHETDRSQQEQHNPDFYELNGKAARKGSETKAEAQRPPNHQGPHSQNFQGSHMQTSQGPYNQAFQDQVQDPHLTHIQAAPMQRAHSSQEWRDPSGPVQSTGGRSRSIDQSSVHSDPATSSRLSQGQVPPSQAPVQPHPQAPPPSSAHPSHRHFSDSAALQYQQWDHRERDKDREHPLTRLEIALAEVQRCHSPSSVVSAGSHGNSGFVESGQGPSRSLSVLEKVSRFERRERAGKQRSHSINNAHSKTNQMRTSEKGGRTTPCGADDLRSMLERSTSSAKAHRTMSYRGGSSEHMKYRSPTDPSSALQRSRSTYHLDQSGEGDNSKNFPWRQDIQEMFGSTQDTTSNRSYRDTLKDAQSKVLRSTSFRRRDLTSSTSPPPPAAPSPIPSSSSHQPPPVPAKYHSLEKKGPKTMPKPQGIVIAPHSPPPPPILSPHIPKERHVISPEVRGPSPPALPRVPPVGPPAVLRICGRKRLGADQKKRSYSEPENLNEVGVSDAETVALLRRGGETSVADRRKMFELAASRVKGGAPQNATSRPDLRQLQQDALAEYVERKRSVKKEDGGQRSGLRPHSAYIHPEYSNHTASSCYSDTLSLSSASSLLSLQDFGLDRSFSSGERQLCSTLPPGADLRSHQSNYFYPGRVTTPRPPAQPPPSAPAGSPPELQAHILHDSVTESGFSRQVQMSSRGAGPGQRQPLVAEPQVHPGLSKQLDGALQRAGSVLRSGKSASAENLLERSEEKQMTPQHHRSRSSPTVERLNQDFHPRDISVFSEPGCHSLAEGRSSVDHVSPQHSQYNLNTAQPAGPMQDPGSSQTPVPRRERPRNGERQRANSTSTLAASVGLPCPFSPPGMQGGGSAEWHASEGLSKANLDAITFPGLPQTTPGDGYNEIQTRHSLSDTRILEDPPNDTYRERAFSLEMRGGRHEDLPDRINSTSNASPPPSPDPSTYRHLSSLRISESSLLTPVAMKPPLEREGSDDVFLQNPAPPSPPPPIKETNIVEDFPPPPPPVDLEQDQESSCTEFLNHSITPTKLPSLSSTQMPPSSSFVEPSVPSVHPPQVLQNPTTSITAPTTTEVNLEYQPLPKREKTPEEQRVEALSRQLVMQDRSLTPLLDTWRGRSTVELMDEIFQKGRLVGKPLWLRRGSSRLEERIQDGLFDPVESTETDGGKETNVDEEEKDLNTRKVELCEALRCSVAAVRQEKEVLCEEQQRHKALGASVEALVQEHLKANERDKYSMFIGDLEKIVNLLLSLCSRLSRIDRSLLALDTEDLTQEDAVEERDSLHHKRSLLLRQTEDALELKENLERRQRVVHSILSAHLTESQLQDYCHFVSTKPSLLIRQRQLDDLVRQGEDQLTRLAESLPQELVEAHGWSRGCLFSSPSPAHCSSPLPPLLPPSVIPGPTHAIRPTTVTSL